MLQRVPRDILCHARILQRVKMTMGQLTYSVSSNSTVEQTMASEFHAYWIDSVGVYYFQWEWSSSLPEEIIKLLNEHEMVASATHKHAEPIDNLSEAGRRAVFMIDSLLPKVAQIAVEVFEQQGFKYVPSHQWEELVRNAIR